MAYGYGGGVMNDGDVHIILAKRHHNGGDYWATADGRIYVGSPFSTLSSLGMLYELGVSEAHEAVEGALALVFGAWRDDGRIRLAPKAPLYPCYTAEAARILGLSYHQFRYYLRKHDIKPGTRHS